MQGYARRETGRAIFYATGNTYSFTEIGARFYGRDLGRVETVDI
jgi:hypothetical protein